MKCGTPETLQDALKEVIRHIRAISDLQEKIDAEWGVRLTTGFIPSIRDAKGEINIRRGMEEVEKALGKESRFSEYSRYTKELRYNGVQFIQYADDKTKVFVKAGCQPPKVVIVEDAE